MAHETEPGVVRPHATQPPGGHAPRDGSPAWAGGCGRRGAPRLAAPGQSSPPSPRLFVPQPVGTDAHPGRVRSAASPRERRRLWGAGGLRPGPWGLRSAPARALSAPGAYSRHSSEERPSSEGLNQLSTSTAFIDDPLALPGAFLPRFFFFSLGTTVFRFGFFGCFFSFPPSLSSFAKLHANPR